MEKPVSGFNRSVKQINKNDHAFRQKPETDDIDDEIVKWILVNRKLGITVTSWEVIVKASTIKEELKTKKLECTPKVVLSAFSKKSFNI